MRKGNMTIFASVLAIALVAAGIGMGTMAWFTDTAIVGPIITAGNVDLLLSGSYGGSYGETLEIIFPVGFAPGDSYKIDVYLKNTGTTGMRALWVYGQLIADSSPRLSKQIYITKVGFQDISGMVYPGTEGTFYETGTVDDYNIFGDATSPLTLYEFCTSRVPDTSWGYMRFFWGESVDMIDYLPAGGAIRHVELTFYFNELAGNNYQNLVCDFDIVFYATDDLGYSVIWENIP